MTTLRQIAIDVATEHNLTLDDLQSTSRLRRIAHARQEAMRRQREQTGASYPRIAMFWGRDHSTVMHAVKVAERRAGV